MIVKIMLIFTPAQHLLMIYIATLSRISSYIIIPAQLTRNNSQIIYIVSLIDHKSLSHHSQSATHHAFLPPELRPNSTGVKIVTT